MCVVFFVLFCWTLQPLRTFDFWFHAEVGRQMVESLQLPWSDAYLGTSSKFAFHKYGNYAWLSCLLIYFVLTLAGPLGLVFLKSTLLMTTAVIVYRICRHLGVGRHPSLLLVTLGLWTIRLRWMLRTVLFTDIALALLILLFLKCHDKPQKRLLYVGLLFVLWSNLHAGVLAGWVFVFLWFVFGRYPIRETFATLVVVFLASHLRPHGHQLIPYWIDHFDNAYAFQAVSEWRPFGLTEIALNHGPLLLLSAFTLVTFFYQNRKNLSEPREAEGASRIPWHYPVILLAFIYFSIKTRRGLGELLPVAIPMLAALRPRLNPPKWWPWAATLIMACLMISTTNFRSYSKLSSVYPIYPVQLVNSLSKDGQIYNSYEFGGYLVYKGFRPFIHGRTDLYAEGLFEVSNSIVILDERREQLFEEYSINQVILHSPYPNDPLLGLIDYLHRSDDWKLICFDDSGLVFKKTEEEGLSALTPWVRPGIQDPQLASVQLEKLLRDYPSSTGFVMLSEALRSLQRLPEAMSAAQKALELDPDSLAACLELAYSSSQLQKADLLLLAAKQGLKIEPESALMNYFLGLALYLDPSTTTQVDDIQSHLQRALELDPQLRQAAQLSEMIRNN